MVSAERLADVTPPPIRHDAEVLGTYLEDASGRAPGHAAGVVRAADEAEAAAFLRVSLEQGLSVLPQAARSSLTGGAIPQGEVVLSVERMRAIEGLVCDPAAPRGTFGPGLRLREMQDRLRDEGLYYPPVPTYQEAMIGGAVATNAGGAATFKYGVTRDWVRGLRVLLFNGDRLTLERGQALAGPAECFRIALSDGSELVVPVTQHELPPLKKLSAGYHAADPLDLVDLFVGSEGTLGLITAVTVDLVPLPPAVVTGLVFLDDPHQALDLANGLRRATLGARATGDPFGPDVRAIEWLDAGAVQILRQHDDARLRRVDLPPEARSAILFEMELSKPTDDEEAQALLLAYMDRRPEGTDHALFRLFQVLEDHDALERLTFAFPEETGRHAALVELREKVPQRVGEMLAERRLRSPGVKKVGGDLIVPFECLGEMIEIYRQGFERRGLDYAIWGHLGDGNLHPNAIPRDGNETERGFEALLEFADEAIRRGGSPLSEHGVGRNPVKQEMLRRFLGASAIERMRRIKEALDPGGRFAPGVLFPSDSG